MNSPKVIFLDFDGVIVSGKSYLEANPENVAHLNTIIEKSQAQIVISSSWRIGRSIMQLKDLLLHWGVRGVVIGTTPNSWGGHRGQQIKRWMDDNERIDVVDFVILDDSSDIQPLEAHHVQPHFHQGLQLEHVNQALRILGCL